MSKPYVWRPTVSRPASAASSAGRRLGSAAFVTGAPYPGPRSGNVRPPGDARALSSKGAPMSIPGIPEQVQGSLDGVEQRMVRGWARDVETPDAVLEIEILIDGQVAGRGLCDHYRADLAGAGLGSGRYGFAVPLDLDWEDGRTHDVRARPLGTDIELDNSPMVLVIGDAAMVTNLRPSPFAADTVVARDGSLDAVRAQLATRGRLALFATFQPLPTPPSYLIAYLEALRRQDVAVVVVDTSPTPVQLPAELAPLVLRRKNVGWDFASWLAGLHEVRGLMDATEELLLTNDSVFGPIFPLAETWENPRIQGADVWGITDSWSIGYHLQSYFLVFRKRALQSDAFWRYLEDYPFPAAKRQVVRDGEVGLTTALRAAGMSIAATAPYEDVARAWLDGLGARIERIRAYPENAFMTTADLEVAVRGREAAAGLRHLLEAAQHVRRGIPLNQTHFFWDTLLTDFRVPFLKRDLMMDNPAEVPYATEVRPLIERVSEYDVDHIRDAARAFRGSRLGTI